MISYACPRYRGRGEVSCHPAYTPLNVSARRDIVRPAMFKRCYRDPLCDIVKPHDIAAVSRYRAVYARYRVPVHDIVGSVNEIPLVVRSSSRVHMSIDLGEAPPTADVHACIPRDAAARAPPPPHSPPPSPAPSPPLSSVMCRMRNADNGAPFYRVAQRRRALVQVHRNGACLR